MVVVAIAAAAAAYQHLRTPCSLSKKTTLEERIFMLARSHAKDTPRCWDCHAPEPTNGKFWGPGQTCSARVLECFVSPKIPVAVQCLIEWRSSRFRVSG